MNAWIAVFLRELHRQFLKPAGFKKEGQLFSRERAGYVERFQFQGSGGNQAQRGRFYLNVGMEFSDLPPGEKNWVYFKRTHWAGRASDLLPTAPDDWVFEEGMTDPAQRAAELASVVEQCSQVMAARQAELRVLYENRVRRGLASG